MRTTWEEIKERVEVKVGEELDAKTFATFANEAISELNEVAYLEAPAIRYFGSNIIRKDPSVTFTYDEIYSASGLMTLPFEYTIGVNQLTFTIKSKKNNTFTYSEMGDAFDLGTQVMIGYTALEYGDEITISKDVVKKTPNTVYTNEVVVELPVRFSTMIRLEVITSSGDVVEAKEVSINSFDWNDLIQGTNAQIVYYIYDGLIHVVYNYGFEINEIKLYATRTMQKVSHIESLSVQYVEIEANYENMFVYSISHKFLENFVGTEDSETNNMFKKYETLRQEYELKRLPKKLKRRQKSVETKY